MHIRSNKSNAIAIHKFGWPLVYEYMFYISKHLVKTQKIEYKNSRWDYICSTQQSWVRNKSISEL